MPSSVKSKKSKDRTRTASLSGYASFIQENHFEIFADAYYNGIGKKIPLIRFLKDVGEDVLRDLARKSIHDLLSYLAKGDNKTYIENTVKRWINDQLPIIGQDQIGIDDIVLIENLRKQVFLDFLPKYVKTIDEYSKVTREIDEYLVSFTSTMFKSYVRILENRINQHVDAIQKVNHTYRQAEAITHIGNYKWDLETQELQWSEELYRIYGLNPTEIDLSKSEVLRSFNHPDDAKMVNQHISHSIQTLQPFDFTYRIILKDGTTKKLKALGEVIVDANGKPKTVIGTAQDVTEKDNLIHRLQESEKLYKQAQSLARIGNWEWDIEKNNVTWSDELYSIYGLAPQSRTMNLQSFLELVHPEDVEYVMEQTRQTIQEKRPGNFFHRITLPDGTIKILHAKSEPLVNESGRVLKIIGTTQDITSAKLLEKKLQENQTFIEKIANATPSLIASYNIKTGRYVFVSAGIKKLLGYEPQEVLDKGVAFLIEKIHPDDLLELNTKNTAALEQANKDGNKEEPIVEFQYRLKHANGEYRWFHTFGTVFDRNAKNEVEHVLNISLDITESILAAEVLKQKTSELEQSNANLEEFAFVASHDLKEPLRKIITFADRLLLNEKNNVSQEGRNILDKIMSSSIRMQQMINDLLSLSVISADKSFSKVNLKKLLEEVMMTFEHKIEERKAQIEMSELPEANVVPSQFRQLFQNLISNALKFAKQNVPPLITINHRILKPAEVNDPTLQKSDQYLEIEFSDNGIGFDNAYVEKVFAVFQRLHHREVYEGTGIGLAICKKIAENHGGKISAIGRPSEGAKFIILIPN